MQDHTNARQQLGKQGISDIQQTAVFQPNSSLPPTQTLASHFCNKIFFYTTPTKPNPSLAT